MVSGLVLVELAAIAGLIDFTIGRNCDFPIFQVAVFIAIVKEEAYLLFHVLAHNDEHVWIGLMYRGRTVVQCHDVVPIFIESRNAIKELLLAI